MSPCVGRIACVIRWARREFDEAQPDLRSDTLGGRRRCRELVFTLAHSPHVAVRFAPTTPSCVGAPGLQISYSHVTIPSPQLAPPMCRYARMPVRFHARYAPNHTRTQYPHQQRPRSPPQGYLLTLSVGKVGTRRLGVADRSRSRRGEFRQLAGFRQLRRVPSIARSLHPSRSLMGSTGNPDGISHMCMLSAGRGAGATPT